MIKSFDEITLRNIADIISAVLSHRQITEQFVNSGFIDTGEGTNKTDRVYYSFKARQKQDGCGNNIVSFIQTVFNPKRYNDEAVYEKERASINEKLVYEGIEINKYGVINSVSKARTISEAKERSQKIKQKVQGLTIHREITPYCEEEWLKENYFHAILEITKSVSQRLRDKSGYISDGSELVDQCFGLGQDKKPMLAFNTLQSASDESEHKGFSNFIKGFFSMYRNPKAHNPKILEITQLTEMVEVLVIATIIQTRLDNTHRTGFK